MGSRAITPIPRSTEKPCRVWMVRVSDGRDPVTGKWRYRSKTVHGTKAEAHAAITKMQHQMGSGTYVQPTRETLGEYMLTWLNSSAKMTVREQTLRSYRKLVMNYIIPGIGSRRLSTLSVTDIDTFYASLSDPERKLNPKGEARPLAPRTVQYVHSVLRSALKEAVRARRLAFNPTDHATLPRMAKRELLDVGPSVATKFLAAAEADRWYPLWVLMVTTGLRPGEALGLRWDDIEGDIMRVRRVVVAEPSGRWHFDEPKTARSARAVTLPEIATRALQRHRTRQAEKRLRAGEAYDNDNLIFANEVGHPLDVRNLVRRHLERVLTAAKLPSLRLYDLRHMAATVLMENGEHPKVVSERLGHSTIKLTMDTYSHVTPTMQARTAERLDSIFTSTARVGV